MDGCTREYNTPPGDILLRGPCMRIVKVSPFRSTPAHNAVNAFAECPTATPFEAPPAALDKLYTNKLQNRNSLGTAEIFHVQPPALTLRSPHYQESRTVCENFSCQRSSHAR